jgi:hypothetical protein
MRAGLRAPMEAASAAHAHHIAALAAVQEVALSRL